MTCTQRDLKGMFLQVKMQYFHQFIVLFNMFLWLKNTLWVFAVLCFWPMAFGQIQQSNLHRKNISAKGTVSLDDKSIVPQTFSIQNMDSSYYYLDAINATLVWLKKIPQDSVQVRYRTFPSRLNAIARRYDYDSIVNISITPGRSSRQNMTNNFADNGIFNFGKIDYNGSFGRSMSFGNSQDAVFNSQFNMQMSGYIGDSIEIAAVISDNNIPIQPDGTTQRLNEFDRILLQFKKKNWQIDIGDIDLRQNDNYFLRFYKRLQGLSYAQRFKIGSQITDKMIVSGAVAKGKFARNVLTVTDGNQGPYLLVGNNNEVNFAVLAGTEKVFMDGVQLQRGEDQDYIMDYNTAQVTFTQKNLISKDRRIQIEFEYSDRNYLNSMLYFNNEMSIGKKAVVRVAAYTNADAKNSPINQTLDDAQKQFLANIGDSISHAYYPVSAIDTFDVAKILYRKTDTIVNGFHDSVYVYSTDPANAKYSLSFANVGANEGNYVAVSGLSNGQVFQWVAPVNQVPQGNYEPAAFLVTPKSLKVITVGADYNFDKKNMLSAQLASSKYDVNTFSRIDKANDNGLAGKLQFAHLENLQSPQGKKYLMTVNAGYEWTSANFQTVERIRSVEFARDWGLSIIPEQTSEKLPSLSVAIADDKNNAINYQFGGYFRGDGFSGIRNVVHHQQRTDDGWSFDEQLSLTTSQNADFKGTYWRPTINVSKQLKGFFNYSVGGQYLAERNAQRSSWNDSLSAGSFAFQTISAYIKSDPSKLNNWGFQYYNRQDQLPDSALLKKVSFSNNYTFSGQLMSNQHHQFKLNVTYRELQVLDSLRSGQKPEKTLLGRLEYAVHEWNGFLVGNALYELGSGQEQKKEYTYVQVPAGQGQYTWNDYNKDGIPQLNEFELAAFKDQANYLRIYTVTNQFVKSNYTQLNYSMMLQPQMLVRSDTMNKWQKIYTKLSLQSSLQSGKKQIANGIQFSPFQGNIADTSLINLNYIWSNTLSINRAGLTWGLDVSNLVNYNKSLMTYGTESRQQKTWNIKGRYTIARTYSIELVQKIGNDNLLTPAFQNQNYTIRIFSTEPTLSYTYSSKFRMLAGYLFSRKKNAEEYGGEKATINTLRLESKVNSVNSMVLSGKFLMTQIQYTGDVNSAVGYNVLDGLLPGKNFQWSLGMTKRLLRNLEFSLQYDGRRAAASRTIHIGTASIRAVL